jgi:hypothetical protein
VDSEVATVMRTPLDAGGNIAGPNIEDLKKALQPSAQ